MRAARPVLIVFAKAPVPGRVKRRLWTAISPAEAARLHERFVRQTLQTALLVSRTDLELHTDIETDAWRDTGVAMQVQIPGDLALKLFHALASALDAGRPQAIVLGSDSPALPRSHLEALLDCRADVALGPCEDGGFYAIACRRVKPGMFDGVQWSTWRTLEQTRDACERAGLTVETGPLWYDVDTPEDLARWERSLE